MNTGNESNEEKIIDSEYEDWIKFCASAYEESELEGRSDK